jgi:hypothetical protein
VKLFFVDRAGGEDRFGESFMVDDILRQVWIEPFGPYVLFGEAAAAAKNAFTWSFGHGGWSRQWTVE